MLPNTWTISTLKLRLNTYLCHLFPCHINGGWSKCPSKCFEDKSKEIPNQRRYQNCDSPPASQEDIVKFYDVNSRQIGTEK